MLKMLKGWLRRRIYWYFRRDVVEKYRKLRRGSCKNCGRCCRLCPFLDTKTNKCRIYKWRPAICREYPLTPEDVKAIPECGFYFVEE